MYGSVHCSKRRGANVMTDEEDFTFKTVMESGGRGSPVVRGRRLAVEAK